MSCRRSEPKMVGREPRARRRERATNGTPSCPASSRARLYRARRVPVRAPRFVVVAAAITIMRGQASEFRTLATVPCS